MNSPWMRWLLDVESIPADLSATDEPLRLTWEQPFPGWAWLLIVLASLALAWWSYSRLTGPKPARVTLAAMRAALLLLVCVLLSRPALELPRETIEPDWVIVLADRSQSMRIADVVEQDRPPRRMTRDQQLASLLDASGETWQRIDAQRELVWLGFDRGAYDLADGGTAPADTERDAAVSLGAAEGRQTRISAALDHALQRAAARPVSGIVLFSDGQTIDPPTRSIVRRLQQEQIPVHVVPLGSDEPLGDVAIRRAEAPGRAFIRDRVPVTVDIERIGDGGAAIEGTIRLVDEATGETLDEIDLPPAGSADADRTAFTLNAEPTMAGSATWRVEIDTDQPVLIPENTVAQFAIELIDRPLRVLYVDGYPRWEYRYLKSLLVRESSIESSIILLSADRDFAQEGNLPVTRMPRTSDEFADFDVIILGDVPGSFFSATQLDLMHEHIAERGAGLLWVGGERYTPSTYAGTVLVDVLPMRSPLNLSGIGRPVTMQPTNVAERLGVLRLTTGAPDGERIGPAGAAGGWPEALLDPSYGWSRLFWAQRIEREQLKPAVEVLAETVDRFSGGASGPAHLPLAMRMRFGAGQVMYVATDEIWRWRYGRGELLPEQFWVQIIRLLGRESLVANGDRALLDVRPSRVLVGQPMTIELRVLDSMLADAINAGPDGRREIDAMLETSTGEPVAALTLRSVNESDNLFRLTYVTDTVGQLRVRVTDDEVSGAAGGELRDLELMAPVEVAYPDDELRQPQTDHELLAALASQTGGAVLDETGLARLDDPQYLRNRSIRTLNPLRESIWDTPLAFSLVLLLLTLEWIGRKIIRLA